MSRIASFGITTFVSSVSLLMISNAFASDQERDKFKHANEQAHVHWSAEKTSVSELSDSERKGHLGLIRHSEGDAVSSGSGGTGGSGGTFTGGAAPATVDWRNVNGVSYVSPIKNQGSCGSCWAFATTAALESQVMMSEGVTPDLSEQVMLSCSGAGSCAGGYPDQAANFIVGTGLPGENYYPYIDANGACANAASGWQNYTQKAMRWMPVSQTVSAIESAVSLYGPVMTTFDVYADFYYYAGGVYTHTSGAYEGGHAVLIVGYDDVNQYFIVKNSWGTGWGEAGFFRIAFSEMTSVSEFGMDSQAYYSSNALPSFAMSSPNGGENLTAGSNATIQWVYQGSPGSTVSIELLKSGAPYAQIASSVSVGSNGSGSYVWSIPSAQQLGSDYQISITSVANPQYSSTSAGDFTIVGRPVISAPTGLSAALVSSQQKHGKTVTTTTSVQLSWSRPSSVGSGLKSYSIFRNGSLLKSGVTSTSYSDTSTVAHGGAYAYTVEALDSSGQVSPVSNAASISR